MAKRKRVTIAELKKLKSVTSVDKSGEEVRFVIHRIDKQKAVGQRKGKTIWYGTISYRWKEQFGSKWDVTKVIGKGVKGILYHMNEPSVKKLIKVKK